MSDPTLPADSYVLLPLSVLDGQKRLNECARAYRLDIRGSGAEAAVAALPPPEAVGPGYPQPTRYVRVSQDYWQVYKNTLMMARTVESTLDHWQKSNVEREITMVITSAEWSSQQYADAVHAQGSAFCGGNLVLKGGPWEVLPVVKNGVLTSIELVNISAKPAPKAKALGAGAALENELKAAAKKAPVKKAPVKKASAKGARRSSKK